MQNVLTIRALRGWKRKAHQDYSWMHSTFKISIDVASTKLGSTKAKRSLEKIYQRPIRFTVAFLRGLNVRDSSHHMRRKSPAMLWHISGKLQRKHSRKESVIG